jgi:uncharacterized Zn finger protein (UPF0148 family)
MNHFLKSIMDWMLEKEEEMAKKNAIPMKDIEQQIAKVKEQKVKLEKQYDEATSELNDVLSRLEKIKDTENLRATTGNS